MPQPSKELGGFLHANRGSSHRSRSSQLLPISRVISTTFLDSIDFSDSSSDGPPPNLITSDILRGSRCTPERNPSVNMATTTQKRGSHPDLLLVKEDGQIFMSMEYVDRIPTSQPISRNLFSEPIGFNDSDCIVVCRGGRLFLSVDYLNRYLKSANQTKKLSVVLAIQSSNNDGQHVTLKVQDRMGSIVPLKESVTDDLPQDVAVKQETNSPGCVKVVERVPQLSKQQTGGMVESRQLSQGGQEKQNESHQGRTQAPRNTTNRTANLSSSRSSHSTQSGDKAKCEPVKPPKRKNNAGIDASEDMEEFTPDQWPRKKRLVRVLRSTGGSSA